MRMRALEDSCPIAGLALVEADGVLTAVGANTTVGYCRFNDGGEVEYLFVGATFRRKGVALWLLDEVARRTGKPLFFRDPISPLGRKLVDAYAKRQAQNPLWPPTRAAALARLEAFLPAAGAAYAARRNTDFGPQDRSNVSQLSPYLRRRLLTEAEVARAAHARHGAAAEKFIQEVCWRTYWKGWLNQRPHVHARYEADIDRLTLRLGQDAKLAARHIAATQGASGLPCFDAWAQELITTGWLHNHARMWFASIWIFTLELPWQLGAAFFETHLLDADPASNLLSWRWVAGLHTQGKHYVARAENIRAHTNGRFDPRDELNETAAPLPDDGAMAGPLVPLPVPARSVGRRVALLLGDDDLNPESLFAGLPVVAVAALDSGETGAPAKRAFLDGARADALARASAAFGVPSGGVIASHEIAGWAAQADADEIVTAYAPVGPGARALADVRPAPIRLSRRWDVRAWPHARAGFFKFRQTIPALLAD